MGTSHDTSMPEHLRRHTACVEHDGKHCDVCETPWPCPTYAGALDAVRARASDRDLSKRDTAIRHALAVGVPVPAVSEVVGVTRARIKQIGKRDR